MIINNETFFIDYRYPMIRELVSSDFEEHIASVEDYFLEDNKRAKKAIEQAVKAGAMNDVPSGCILTMAELNMGNTDAAKALGQKLYELNPHDLLARCTYLNNNLMANKYSPESLELVGTVFKDNFDLGKVTTQRTIPLIAFADFMSLSIVYLLNKGDDRFIQQLIYLVAGAPEHDETDSTLEMLTERSREAKISEKDIKTLFKGIFEAAEKISEPLSCDSFSIEDDCSHCKENPAMAEYVKSQNDKGLKN